MFKFFLTGLLFIGHSFLAVSQNNKTHWVDSVFQQMTVEQKIGQLFMLPVSTAISKSELAQLKTRISRYQPGSILVTRGGVNSHIRMLNDLQQLSRIPLAAGITAEWGVGQTLDSATQFAKPMIQGAIQNDSLIYQLGKEIGRQLKILGIQINFAPNADLDILSMPYPQSLGFYGQNKNRVAAKNIAFSKGLAAEGVLTCAKFTPDTYQENSTLSKTEFFELTTGDSITLFPIAQLIREGVGGILTSHLHFSVTEKKKRVPATVSQLFMQGILKDKMTFQGLTFCDIPYLKKLSNKKRAGEAEKLAFTLGHDVMIAPEKLGESIGKIARVVKNNPAMMNQLSASVKKILAFKYESGLAQNKLVNSDNIFLKLNSPESQLLKLRLAEQSVTVLKNQNNQIPFTALDEKSFVSISVGREKDNDFSQFLSKYTLIHKAEVRTLADTILFKKISKNKIVIISLFPNASSLLPSLAPKILKLASTHEVILCSFGNPQLLSPFEKIPTITISYSDEGLLPQATAQILFGAMEAKGALPFTISTTFREGQTIKTSLLNRFHYTIPEDAGMDSKTLDRIKDIAREAIDIQAFPGCQILVAKDGKVVFNQSFGWLTYDNQVPVTDSTIYDLASITKVAATLQTVMFLKDRNLVDLNKKASTYLPELATSNKKNLTLKDILTHQSGLVPFIHMWPETVKDKQWMPYYYQTERSENYPLQVAPKLFASRVLRDSAWRWTLQSKMADRVPRTPYTYRYSDLGSIILHQLANKTLNQPMEDFLHQNLYDPLGAGTLGYTPLDRFPSSQIAPTENDTIFRKQWIAGTVHDERAALFGGVAGHAGLFGNANDLAKLGQMLLNGGSYGGDQYYKPETVDLFISKQYEDSRRGLGWDKPTPGDWNGPTALQASPETFGHTGFTGTCIWVDPKFNLVFVLLSNRVYPYRSNNKISSANIRPRIQEVIYKSIFDYCQNQN